VQISRKELIRRFKKLGFQGPFSGGRHQFMQRGALKLRVPNPHTGGIHISLLKEILRQGKITWNEWEKAGR
jgi:predicted RNA binding protein YcfA (HicA-like mRNA interferase family)